jgi:hypothetical protein
MSNVKNNIKCSFKKNEYFGVQNVIGVDNYILKKFFKNKSTTPSWVVRLSSHMGAEKYPTVGSSGEYWSMNESLNQHFA